MVDCLARHWHLSVWPSYSCMWTVHKVETELPWLPEWSWFDVLDETRMVVKKARSRSLPRTAEDGFFEEGGCSVSVPPPWAENLEGPPFKTKRLPPEQSITAWSSGQLCYDQLCRWRNLACYWLKWTNLYGRDEVIIWHRVAGNSWFLRAWQSWVFGGDGNSMFVTSYY